MRLGSICHLSHVNIHYLRENESPECINKQSTTGELFGECVSMMHIVNLNKYKLISQYFINSVFHQAIKKII